MLPFYLKLAVRNFYTHNSSTIINLLGISTGTAAFLFLLHYVNFHYSFDNFHSNADNVYTVWSEKYVKGELQEQTALSYAAIAPISMAQIPEIKSFVRFYEARNTAVISYNEGNKIFNEEGNIYFVEPSVFDAFDIELISGNEDEALSNPNSIIISQRAAHKYFGNKSGIGERLKLQDSSGNLFEGEVKGIFKDLPENTHLPFDFLFSYSSLSGYKRFDTNWSFYRFYTYLTLENGASPQLVEQKLNEIAQPNLNSQNKAMGVEEYFHLLPIQDIHFTNYLEDQPTLGVDKKSVDALLFIGMLILVIAWVNYINITTAKASERSAEVGIKKVLGASRRSLFSQFVYEVFLLNSIGTFCGIALFKIIDIALPQYAYFLQFETIKLTLFLLPISLIATILASFYPTWLLTNFKPIKTLKASKGNSKASTLRGFLVTTQFTISIILLSVTLAVFYQNWTMEAQPLGFEINQKIIIKPPSVVEAEEGKNRYSTYVPRAISFKESLLQLDDITGVTESGNIPGKAFKWKPSYIGLTSTNTQTTQSCMGVDRYFLDTYQIPIIAGRGFKENSWESAEVIINEKSAKTLGFEKPEAALGVQIYCPTDLPELENGTIVGVVANYHHESLQKAIEPIVFIHRQATWEPFTLQLSTNNTQQTLAKIQDKWEQYFPGNPFDFYFLDEFYNQQYQQEKQYSQLLIAFSSLSILIACLGLYGMVSYQLLLKQKEIGIRKVLGASSKNIIVLLSSNYLRLLLLAFLLSIPLANYLIQEWLKQFAYQIEITWWLFAIPAFLIMLIAGVTLSWKGLQAAQANPVDSIRD